MQQLEGIVRGSLGPLSSDNSKGSNDDNDDTNQSGGGHGGGQVRRAIKDIIPG